MLDVFIETWGNADITWQATSVEWSNGVIQVATHRGGGNDKSGLQIWYERLDEEIKSRRVILHFTHKNQQVDETKYHNSAFMKMNVTNTKLILCNESRVKLTIGSIYKV